MKQLFIQDDSDNFTKVPNKISKTKTSTAAPKRTPKKSKPSDIPNKKEERKSVATRKRKRTDYAESLEEEEERPLKRMKTSHVNDDDDYLPY